MARRLHRIDGRPILPRPATDRLPLPGGETANLELLVDSVVIRNVPEATARHLVHRYGSEAAAVVSLVERNRLLSRPIVEGLSDIRAEVTHAVEREMAVRLSDVLIRRLHLFHEDIGHAVKAAPAVARKLRELLGWDAAREVGELADYLAQVERGRRFRTEVGLGSKVAS